MTRDRMPVDRMTCPDCHGQGCMLYVDFQEVCPRCEGIGWIGQTIIPGDEEAVDESGEG